MFFRHGMAILLAAWSSSALAISADVSIGEDSARFEFGSYVSGLAQGRTQSEIGLLYNTDEDNVFHAGMHVYDIAGTKTPGLQLGIGGRVYAGDVINDNVIALGLGAEVLYRPDTANRLGFGASVHYAPDVVSFVDCKRYLESALKVEYSLLPKANVYLGYRRVSGKTDSGKFTADDGAHVGVNIQF